MCRLLKASFASSVQKPQSRSEGTHHWEKLVMQRPSIKVSRFLLKPPPSWRCPKFSELHISSRTVPRENCSIFHWSQPSILPRWPSLRLRYLGSEARSNTRNDMVKINLDPFWWIYNVELKDQMTPVKPSGCCEVMNWDGQSG